MKLLFMGTPEFAAPSLARLIESRHEVALVVTQPTKGKGRGQKPADPPVKVLADQHGIPVLQPSSLKSEPLEPEIKRLGIDLGIVVAYGKLLPTSLLEAPRLGCINVHASLLPEYRGAAPIQRAIMDGQQETGVTIMKIVPELDAGPMIAHEVMAIEPDDDSLSVTHFLSVLGADLLIRVLDDIEASGKVEGIAQDDSLATYAPRIRKEEGLVDWTLPSEQIMFRLRGLTPWPGLYSTLGDKRLRLIQAEPLPAEEAKECNSLEDASPGTITAILRDFGFAVRTGDGHLLITRLQAEGKPAMEAPAYLNGNTLKVGQTFEHPA